MRVYAVKKEVPYLTDGIPQESAQRFEAYLVAPEGREQTNLSFRIRDQKYGGEMSYDNVRREYFYSCSLDVSTLSSIDCVITYGEEEFLMTAQSVLTEKTLTPKDALTKLIALQPDLFTSMTDKYGFSGEIYLRLIYEGTPYYYVGVIDREGKITAFLLNAETGKLLAQRGN